MNESLAKSIEHRELVETKLSDKLYLLLGTNSSCFQASSSAGRRHYVYVIGLEVFPGV